MQISVSPKNLEHEIIIIINNNNNNNNNNDNNNNNYNKEKIDHYQDLKYIKNRWDDEKVKLEECFAWLSSWKNAPTHTIAGVQELYQQLLLTKVYYNRKTKSQVTEEKCRLCGDSLENVQRILFGCNALAQTKYLQRHNNAFKILFFEVLRSLDLITKVEPWFNSSLS